MLFLIVKEISLLLGSGPKIQTKLAGTEHIKLYPRIFLPWLVTAVT